VKNNKAQHPKNWGEVRRAMEKYPVDREIQKFKEASTKAGL